MLLFVILALLVAVGFRTASAARERGAPRRSLSATALRRGAAIAGVRLVVFYCGVWLLGYSDERQVLGYAFLILNSVVELGLAKSLSGAWTGALLLIAALIVLTSVLLGFAWAWLRFRPRSGGAV